MDETTYYIRHTHDIAITEETFRQLFESKRIGIHYPELGDWDGSRHKYGEIDNPSTDPNDYPPQGQSRNVLQRLNELASNGGYVCAEYFLGENKPTVCRIGYVKPGSSVEIFEGKWDPNCAKKWTPSANGERVAALKTIRLETCKDDLPASVVVKLLLGRPRQGTFSRTYQLSNRVKLLLHGGKLEPIADSLTPTEAEVLCAEYLRTERSPFQITHLLTPVGRTMRTFDILGLSKDGKKVFGQVTHYTGDQKETAEKANVLLREAQGEDSHLVFFCRSPLPTKYPLIRFVDLDQVFEYYLKADPKFLSALTSLEIDPQAVSA